MIWAIIIQVFLVSLAFLLGGYVTERHIWRQAEERLYEADVLMTENPEAIPEVYKVLWEIRSDRGWHRPRKFKKPPF